MHVMAWENPRHVQIQFNFASIKKCLIMFFCMSTGIPEGGNQMSGKSSDINTGSTRRSEGPAVCQIWKQH